MTADYPVDEAHATPEYVLEVLRDWHAQLAALGEALPDFKVTAEATVDEFAEGCVELNWESCHWRTVADALNDVWELTISKDEWQPVLTPGDARTLGDVARFLAARVRRPVVRPWRYIAGDCLPAGYFLTIRALLAASGANPDAITPSTPIEPFLTCYHANFFRRLTQLAPRRLPPMHFQPFHWSGIPLMLVGLLLVLIGTLTSYIGLPAVSVFCTVAGLVLIPVGYLLSHTERVLLPGLVTFRDLAYALAGQQPRRRIQPTP
jgi:hypothetical protein